MPTDPHTYRVSWSPEDAEYLATCHAFPSLSWLALTPAQALAGIRTLVDDIVADVRARGESTSP